MVFGQELRSASSPGASPTGIGGNASTIWHCDTALDKVYELSITDFSVDREASSPSGGPNGIGGDSDTIWHCDSNADQIYELLTTDFSVDRQAASPSGTPTGIGGDASTIWHSDTNLDKVYELSTTDFSVDREAASPRSSPYGIGGDASIIWHSDALDPDKVYELSTTDFSVNREADSPSTSPQGIGGDSDTIWHCDNTADKVYELDVPLPGLVATGVTNAAVRYGYQRQSFYAADLFWAFYITGSTAYYEHSHDGIDWDEDATSLGTCGPSGTAFSVWFDGTHIHYARFDNSLYNLYYRRGTPVDDGTINWSAEQLIYNGELGDDYHTPCISVDSDGYAWIGVTNDQPGGDDLPVVLKNANLDGTWANDNGFPYELSAISTTSWRVCPVPLTDGKVYVIYCRDGQLPLGKLYDEGWGAEESDLAGHNIQDGELFSAGAYVDNVHFIYNRETTYQIRHNERVWDVGWNVADVLVQDAVTDVCGPALSVNTVTGNLYCFWALSSTDYVYYKKYDGGWDADPTNWIDETTDEILFDCLITSFYQDYGGYIGLLYITKLASPYNIKFKTVLLTTQKTFTADTVLTRAWGTKDITADALLKKTLPKTLTADAIIVKYETVPHTPVEAEVFAASTSGSWVPYDLYTEKTVPKGAVAEIVIRNGNTGTERIGGVREKDSGLNRYIQLHEAEGDGYTTAEMFIQTDAADGTIEVYAESNTDVDFVLMGYFEGCGFTERFDTLGAPSDSWNDKDLGAWGCPPNAVVQVLGCCDRDNDVGFIGVKARGSALERGFTLDEAEGGGNNALSLLVKADWDSQIEIKGSNGDTRAWTLGWFSDVVDFTEAWTQVTFSGPRIDGEWESRVVSGPRASFAIAMSLVHQDKGAQTNCGVREEGSSQERKILEHEAEGGGGTGFMACVNLDANNQLEIYCGDSNESLFYYSGYFELIGEAPAQETQTYTSDARLIGRIPETFTGDSLLLKTDSEILTGDAELRDRLTETFPGDSVLVNRLTETFPADVLLLKTTEKIPTSDAILVNRLPKTLTGDALLLETLPETITGDAVLRERYTEAITGDVVIVDRLTEAITTDAELRERYSKALASDAILKLRIIKVLGVDALLLKAFLRNFTADGYLTGTGDQTLTGDALLKKIGIEPLPSDSVLVNRLTEVFTGDVEIRDRFTETYTADARLKYVNIREFTGDTVLKGVEVETKEFTGDVLLKKAEIEEFTADVLLKKALDKNFTTDVLLMREGEKELSVMSVLVKRLTKTFDVDVLLRARGTKTFTGDAPLIRRVVETFTNDAELRRRDSKTLTGDAELRDRFSKSLTGDAPLISRVTETFTTDAVLAEEGTFERTFTSDALLEKAFERTFTGDGLLLKAEEKTWTADGVLKIRLTKTYTTDVVLVDQLPKPFQADGVVINRIHETFTSDAVVIKRPHKELASDAILVNWFTKDFTTDAVLSVRLGKSLQTDGVVVDRLSKQFTGDTLLVKKGDKTFTADAVVTEIVQEYKTFTADAVLALVETYTKTYTTDTLLLKAVLKTFTTDGRVIGRISKTLTGDALLVKQLGKALSANSVLVSRPEKELSAMAILVNRFTEDFTGDTIIVNRYTETLTADTRLTRRVPKTLTADGTLTRVYAGIEINLTLMERGIEMSTRERNITMTPMERGIEMSTREREISLELRERGISISFRDEEQKMVNIGDTFQLAAELTDYGAPETPLTPDTQDVRLYDSEGTLIDTDTAPAYSGTAGLYYAKLEAKVAGIPGSWRVEWEAIESAEQRTVEFDVHVGKITGGTP